MSRSNWNSHNVVHTRRAQKFPLLPTCSTAAKRSWTLQDLSLGHTYRLHPNICQYASELYYDNRLVPVAGLGHQVIHGPSRFAGNGLFYVPVSHSRNRNQSAEEVDVIAGIVDELLSGYRWADSDRYSRELTERDMLIIAPYNSQIAALKRRLGDRTRVQTVDRFQG